MDKVRLVKVAKINMGQSPPSSSYNSVGDGLPFFQGKADFGDIYPSVRFYCTEPTKIAQKDDILMSVRAPVGSININKVEACIGRGLAAIKNSKDIEHKYLYHFLNYYEPKLAEIGKGSTFEAVNREDIENIEIPLPKPDEQKRIAAILDKADRLRRQRRFAQKLSDSFLQSVFINMFGDLRFQKDGKFETLGNLSEIVSGVTKGQKFNGKKTVVVPYLRVANVQDGHLNLSEIKMIEALESDAKKLMLQKGDILMTEGGDYDKLGRGALWNGEIENCIHQNHIFRVRVNLNLLSPIFFALFLRTSFAKEYFLRCSKQTTNLATINMTQLKELPVPVLSLPLQEKFAEIVQKFERVRRQQREATRQAEHLFQTLLHRAFRGEL